MTERPSMEYDEPDTDSAESPDPTDPATTGVRAVDQVLADVDRIDDMPLEGHLAAFERAHDSLRSALDAQPDEGTAERSDASA